MQIQIEITKKDLFIIGAYLGCLFLTIILLLLNHFSYIHLNKVWISSPIWFPLIFLLLYKITDCCLSDT